MLVTDLQCPNTPILARLKDTRARQYWDPQHLLALRLAADSRDPQPKQACCVSNNVLWDLAALYPAGAQWEDKLPTAIFFDGPIVKRKDEFEKALATLAATTLLPTVSGDVRLISQHDRGQSNLHRRNRRAAVGVLGSWATAQPRKPETR